MNMDCKAWLMCGHGEIYAMESLSLNCMWDFTLRSREMMMINGLTDVLWRNMNTGCRVRILDGIYYSIDEISVSLAYCTALLCQPGISAILESPILLMEQSILWKLWCGCWAMILAEYSCLFRRYYCIRGWHPDMNGSDVLIVLAGLENK